MSAGIRILLLADSHIGFDLPTRPRVERRRRGHDFLENYAAALRPALEGEAAPLSYFVAIVGPDGAVLAREEFATEVPLKEERAIIIEELEPEIPLPEGRRAASYTIFVGLVVSEEELAANRR